ncbi:RNA polymerase I-specific transcription initiation factor RRN3-domain-containing protein [Chaetomium tenue]|uniref:RNA polymerase I-specific transcription initiation factor RRN3-domain-containing protein n=1 Tax=Chaetomium tenue TaxID=1854479 RepID=A0ACB7PR23_9PEZI|nr:RNA polymerase I-specific transcription initiation factor RRN3-domain-containing protein [Chaetomium globosum]
MTTLSSIARSSASVATSSPIKPILRKSTSVLGTRSRSEDSDGADEDEPPTKRQKKTVAFNEDLNMIKEINSKSLEEAKREVRQALEGHSRGDDEDYDNLKDIFLPKNATTNEDEDEDETTKPQDLIVYVVALTGYVPLLGRSCSGLLRSVLRCNWLERDENFARAYIQLLAALSSVQGSLFTQALTMIVDKFTETRHTSSVAGFEPVDPETKKKWLHVGLKYLLELFPAGQHIILSLVASKFPFTEATKATHMEFIDHLLRLKAARPGLERDIMELILSRLVKLDVEMTLDLENDDDETTRAVLRQLGASDAKNEEDDDDSDVDSVLSDDDDLNEQAKRVLTVKNKLETMDAILDLLFSIYDPIFEDPESPEATEAFQDLLSDFSNVILPHLKSRHTQYLLFKFAMKSQQLMEMFIGTLFNLAFESNRPPVVKQAAVAYLASFTARGAMVQSEQVQLITKTFLDYMDHYRAVHTGCRGPDVRRYSQYYAYFQGLLYIFCFRWRDLIDQDLLPPSLDWDDPASFVGQELPWMTGLKSRLQANIGSKLNPLKCCSPIIVDEFARLSHHLRLMYIYPQIEKNKSVHLSQFFTGSYATGGALRDSGFEFDDEKWTHLEACFPFDPFQLPIAKRWLDLESSYVAWRPMALLDREGEGEEDEDGGKEEDSEGEGEGDDTSIFWAFWLIIDSQNVFGGELMAENTVMADDSESNRPSFSTFWRKSKEALGGKKIRFVESKPAGGPWSTGASGAQDDASTEASQDKTQARRAQVRKAQVQHRQRKANYVKQLEMDVARIREMIEAAEQETKSLLDENKAMRAQILHAMSKKAAPLTLDQGVHLLQEMPQPCELSDAGKALQQQGAEDPPSLEHLCRAHFHPSHYNPPPPDTVYTSPLIGHDGHGHTLMATSLALRDAPEHIFKAASRSDRLLFPSTPPIILHPTSTPTPPSTSTTISPSPPGTTSDHHSTTATTTPNPQNDTTPPLTWRSTSLTLRSLHGLASSLNPHDGVEVAPVQAWFELVGRFGAERVMAAGVLERLKREFVGVVKCLHYGASVERGVFESVVGRVLGDG